MDFASATVVSKNVKPPRFWTIFVGTIDNVVRPILIRKGAQLPLPLVLAGVLGGLMAFGLVGIFVGPVVLGVSYMLLEAWVREEPAEDA